MKSQDSKSFLDVPAFTPNVPLELGSVGTTRRSFPLALELNGANPTMTTAQVEMAVALSAEQRGVHVSRLGQILNEIIPKSYKLPQDFASNLAQKILKSQSSTMSTVKLFFDWFQTEKTPVTKLSSLKSYPIKIGVELREKPIYEIGVTITGINACPCVQLNAKEAIKARLNVENDDGKPFILNFLDANPVFSHTQRVFVECNLLGKDIASLDFRNLITIVRSIVPISHDILKRSDEVHVVEHAHLNPMFCEDITRAVVNEIFTNFYKKIDNDTILRVTTSSQESIHTYDLVARFEGSLNSVARQLGI